MKQEYEKYQENVHIELLRKQKTCISGEELIKDFLVSPKKAFYNENDA
jgi:hypothetical protein